ncbi:hypothetical protein [Halioxenophilus sp. WMMB6]|uniref:hypothetical protein n=1 Tax=Halioxenophilus sp. WMMB6 TaxID=3073815 RepID=UPI00295F0BC8|nr:hypothetical protein [Halioxenophilus sp. WMMB6]
MSEQVYEIVFRGDIVIGQPIDQVKLRVGQMFKLGPAQVDKLFSGKSVVLKRGLSQEQAAKFRAAFQKAGAVVSVVASAARSEAGKVSPERKLSVAPAGASVIPRSAAKEQPTTAVPNLDHMSLRPQSGDLLDDSERAKAPVAAVQAGEWGLAEPGALLETLADETIPLPIMEADWDVAEAGADLVEPSAPAVAPVAPPDFDIAPVGSQMGEPKSDVPLPEPDTSHLQLAKDS